MNPVLSHAETRHAQLAQGAAAASARHRATASAPKHGLSAPQLAERAAELARLKVAADQATASAERAGRELELARYEDHRDRVMEELAGLTTSVQDAPGEWTPTDRGPDPLDVAVADGDPERLTTLVLQRRGITPPAGSRYAQIAS